MAMHAAGVHIGHDSDRMRGDIGVWVRRAVLRERGRA